MSTGSELSPKIVLIVEGEFDKKAVLYLLRAAELPTNRLHIVAAGGKRDVRHLVEQTLLTKPVPQLAALIDVDAASVPDAEQAARKLLGNPACRVFGAVPEIEAWAFSDRGSASKVAQSDRAKIILRRAPTPESIIHPKRLAYEVFGRKPEDALLRVFESLDIAVATSRCASLSQFLRGMSEMLGKPLQPWILAADGPGPVRDVLAALLRETQPSDTVIFHTLEGGDITSEHMVQEIQAGSPLGREYASEILRLARDLLIEQTRRRKK